MTIAPMMQMPMVQGFEAQIGPAWARVRAAVANLLAGLPNSPSIRSAADLERDLGLAQTLAWQVFTIARNSDGLIGTIKVPGPGATRKLLRAASAKGVPKDRVEEAASAIGDFNLLAKSQAGDRASFTAMVASAASDGTDQIELQYRRSTFRGNAHMWGVQARVTLWAGIYHPGSKPGTIDILSLCGMRGLQRLRPEVPFLLCRPSSVSDRTGEANQCLLRSASGTALPLLEEFSSPGLAERVAIQETDGHATEIYLPHGHVGIPGAVDYTTAVLVRNAEWRGDESFVFNNYNPRTPVEVVIHDVLVYEGLFSPFTISAGVYGQLHTAQRDAKGTGDWSEARRLPVRAEVAHLGRGPWCVACHEISHYPDLIGQVCNRLGWEADKFDVYRCRVQFPVLYADQVIRIQPA